MHYLHLLIDAIDRLAEGNPWAWMVFVGFVIVLGICLVFDSRSNKSRAALKRNAAQADA